MKIVALSDTHTYHNDVEVPNGDVLVFAGDLMSCGRKFSEVQSFARWWNAQPHIYKILVAGNHDRLFQKQFPLCINEFKTGIYLQDKEVILDGVKFYGSPWQPWFYDWAFNVHRGAPIKEYWDKIPNDTDVLITHGPPDGILDQARPEVAVSSWGSKIVIPPSEHAGCEELLKAVERVQPAIHIFGHIHGSYGSHGMTNYEAERLMMPCPKIQTKFYNVSICDEEYNPVNPATVIEL